MGNRLQKTNTEAITDQYHDDVMAGLRSAGFDETQRGHVSRALAFMATSKIRRPDWWCPDPSHRRHITLKWIREYVRAGNYTDSMYVYTDVSASGGVDIRAQITPYQPGRDTGKVEISKVPFSDALTIAAILIGVMDSAEVKP